MSSLPPPQSNTPNSGEPHQISHDINTAMDSMQKAQDKLNSRAMELDKSYAEMEAERSDWEDEKTMIANTQKFDTLIDLNVGGTRYTARLETLTRYPDSMLGAMFSGRHTLKKTAQDEHFIDRSGYHFRHILDFLREPEHFEIDLTGSALKELKREALYFGLNDVMFPTPPPPPVPAAPFEWNSQYGRNWDITQSADGIYYGEYSNWGERIVTICTGCNKGFCNNLSNESIDYWKFANFAVGRVFVAGQPSRSVCNDKC